MMPVPVETQVRLNIFYQVIIYCSPPFFFYDQVTHRWLAQSLFLLDPSLTVTLSLFRAVPCIRSLSNQCSPCMHHIIGGSVFHGRVGLSFASGLERVVLLENVRSLVCGEKIGKLEEGKRMD